MAAFVAVFALSGSAQICQGTNALQLQNDALPPNPAGNQNVAVIRGLCVGDKAAVVFDVGALPKPLTVLEGGILFAGPPGSQAMTTQMEVFDGITFLPNGQAQMGPRVYVDVFPVTLAPNTFSLIDISAFGAQITSDKLVVSFTASSNPNGSCSSLTGYTANFAADTNVPPGTCLTVPERNLLFDPGRGGWWDVTRFRIGFQSWCGIAFNGNWVIRACVELPSGAYDGTGDDLELVSGVGAGLPDGMRAKSATGGDPLIVAMRSPLGTFANDAGFMLLDIFDTNGAPPTPLAPGFWVSAPPIVLGPQNLTPPYVENFTVPGTLGGVTLMFQGAVLSLNAMNGLYGTTDAHVIRIR